MWQWRHCSFPPALCPTPALAQTSPWSLAAWIHLCWHASALPESLCGPHGADWWPSRACCESQPGCSPIPLLTFGKNGDRSVSGLCPNMGLTLCTWDHRNGHRLAAHTGTYTDFFFLARPFCANVRESAGIHLFHYLCLTSLAADKS